MSDEIRVNRPAPAVAARPQAATAETAESEGKSSKTPWIVLAVVVVVIVVLGVLFREKLFGGSSTPAAGAPSGYQAVFLTNGQVYFGKISNKEEDYVKLNDVFYLQVVQPPLQGTPQAQNQQQKQQQPQISLVKLGNELHGPIDEMNINSDHILFYEDLKQDSQVVKAIEQFKANPPQQQGTATPSAQQQQQIPAPPQQQQIPAPAQQQQQTTPPVQKQ